MQTHQYSQLIVEMNSLKEELQELRAENDRQKFESVSSAVEAEMVNYEQGDGDDCRLVKDEDADADKIINATSITVCSEPAAESFLTAGVVYFKTVCFQYFGSRF